MHNAVMSGDITTVDLLLDTKTNSLSKDDPFDLNVIDNDSYSPLGLALREER